MREIQVFFGFVNFYQHFIQGFGKIAGLLTLMLKTKFTIRKLKKFLLSIDVAERDKIGIDNSSNYEDDTVKKLLPKNSNGAMSYLTSNTRGFLT